MNVVIWIVIAIIILAAIAVGAWWFSRQRRAQDVKQHFGPEYDRTVAQTGGDESQAVKILSERRQQVEKVELNELTPEQQYAYTQRWRSIQAQFVDDPGGAVSSADGLITDAMQTIGYPTDEFDDKETAVSVQYPDVAENYRQAHAIAENQSNGTASTENLREAMILFRSLFERLVGQPEASKSEVTQ